MAARARMLAMQRKTTTMRKDLFKHMNKDIEIDEGDVELLERGPVSYTHLTLPTT